MSEPADHDELASLLHEAAEHLRFEHEAGGIGLPWDYTVRAPAPREMARATQAAPMPVSASRPMQATPHEAMAAAPPGPIVLPKSAPKPVVTAAKVSTATQEADLDALLSRAREARKPTAPAVQPTLDMPRAAPAPMARLDAGPRLRLVPWPRNGSRGKPWMKF